MTKQQYNFVKLIENSIQSPRDLNGEILVWLRFSQLEELTELIGHDYFCEGGIYVNLQDDCIVVDIVDILEYLEIGEDVINTEDGLI